MKTKIWKTIERCPNYEVSNACEVRNSKTGRIMKPRDNGQGYLVYGLYDNNGKYTMLKEHRIVATAFIPNPNNLSDVDHMNRVRTDNRISNLRWISRGANQFNKIHNVGIIEHIMQLHKDGYSNVDIYGFLNGSETHSGAF